MYSIFTFLFLCLVAPWCSISLSLSLLHTHTHKMSPQKADWKPCDLTVGGHSEVKRRGASLFPFGGFQNVSIRRSFFLFSWEKSLFLLPKRKIKYHL